jgi:hypothetical protein
MFEQPLRAFADRMGIAGHRPRPLRRALIHRDGSDLVGDARHQLHGGGAGADDSDMLSRKIEVGRPVCRVKHPAGEIVGAVEACHLRIVQLADRADQHRRFDRFGSRRRLQRRYPALAGFVPSRSGQPRVEPDMGANAEFVRDLLQIVLNFLLRREITGPAVSRSEGEGIGMIGGVDAASRIPIDVPGAAHLGVLLDDRIGDAEPAQRDAERDGANAGADDQNMALVQLVRRRRLRRPSRVACDQAHFLADQRRIFGRDTLAQGHVHHLPHQLVAGIGDDRLGTAIAQQLQRGGADFVLDVFRQACLGIRNQAHVAPRCIGRLEPAQVARHVHQHHQQHANVSFRDRRGEVMFARGQCDIHHLSSRLG